MARINRTDVIQKAVNDLAISTSTDKVPNETLDKIQLVYSLNKKFSSFLVSTSSTTTGTFTLTLPTIDSRAEIYLTGIDCGLAKDAACDIATGTVTVTATTDFQGISKNVVVIPVLTLTAQSENVVISFPYPLKLKPNVSLTYTGTFSLGLCSRSISVTGFINSSY